jgi:hypothetical protein
MNNELNMNSYVQELLANLVVAVVDMYELPNGDMSVEMGAELVQIGDKLAELLEDFVEMNK